MNHIAYDIFKICIFSLSLTCYHVSSKIALDNTTLDNTMSLQHFQMDKIQENLIDSNHMPNAALNGVYTECILGLSFSCLQRKLIAFLYELDQMKRINLMGDSVVVLRKVDAPVDIAESARIAQYVDKAYLKEFIDHLIDRFFENHFVRVRIPGYVENSATTMAAKDEYFYLDIDFETDRELGPRESRRKRRKKKGQKKKRSKKYKKKFKMKGLKKLMMVIGMMTCVKLAMMAPIMLGMIGLKAMKALILSVMALTIHKMMMMQKYNLGSYLTSSHDWSSGGHSSGWDRHIDEVPPTSSASTLPHYIEPPSPYTSHTEPV